MNPYIKFAYYISITVWSQLSQVKIFCAFVDWCFWCWLKNIPVLFSSLLTSVKSYLGVQCSSLFLSRERSLCVTGRLGRGKKKGADGMMGREKRRREADILFLFPSSTARFLCFNHCYFYWNGKRELDSKKSPSCDLTCGKSKREPLRRREKAVSIMKLPFYFFEIWSIDFCPHRIEATDGSTY